MTQYLWPYYSTYHICLTTHSLKDIHIVSMFWLFQIFCEPVCTGFDMNLCFHFSRINDQACNCWVVWKLSIVYLGLLFCFLDELNYFLEWLYDFKFPLAMYTWSSFSISSAAFDGVTIFYFSYSDRFVVICQTFFLELIWYLSMNLYSFFCDILFIFHPVLNRNYYYYKMLSYDNILYILCTLSLSDLWLANVFPIHRYSFLSSSHTL